MICLAFGITQAEFYSRVDESNLEADQTALLELYAKIPENKKKLIFDLLNTLSEND